MFGPSVKGRGSLRCSVTTPTTVPSRIINDGLGGKVFDQFQEIPCAKEEAIEGIYPYPH
jgi:hypothetical protein